MHLRLIFLVVLLCTTATSYAIAEDKPRMAVMRFTNNTNAYWWKPGVGAELSEMLAIELRNTKKFKMIERREVDSVISN